MLKVSYSSQPLSRCFTIDRPTDIYHTKREERIVTGSLTGATSATNNSQPPMLDRPQTLYSPLATDDLDHDFCSLSPTFGALVWCMMFTVVSLCMVVLTARYQWGTNDYNPLVLAFSSTATLCPLIPFIFMVCSLCSLFINQQMPRNATGRKTVVILSVFSHMGILVMSTIPYTHMEGVVFGIYALLLLLESVLTRRGGSQQQHIH